MRIAMLAPIAWRTPPRHYGPWENVVSLLTEGLVKRGVDVTLFATGDSQTAARLQSVCWKGYEEDDTLLPKVWECLHITKLFEQADEFDLIHNHFDFLPLTYSALSTTPMITTIHGFSSPDILPVYEKYNHKVYYVSISDADRASSLNYTATVHHGINLDHFTFSADADDYLLFFGRIHHDKGPRDAIEIAKVSGKKLIMAGIIQDQAYFKEHVEPFLAPDHIEYIGSVGPEARNELLGKAQALLHPIHFNEPFGLSVVEATACGTPVIAYDRGSMPEIIRHEHTGFLVKNLEEAISAVEQIEQLSRQDCRDLVEQRFTVDRMVDDYLQVYESILQTHIAE